MWEQIRANQRRSVALITAIAAILLALGYVIGLYVEPQSGPYVGLVVATALLLLLALLEWMSIWDDAAQNHFFWRQADGKFRHERSLPLAFLVR